YQRGKIQDESLYYERKKHDGSYPIIGVNTFINPEGMVMPTPELARSSEEEKQSQIRRLREFQARNTDAAPAMIRRLQEAAVAGDNLFAALMDATRVLSLGQITQALFEVGGKYRRSM
ncbi:MAG: methylmalonyl-CoA mutase, partial [Rhodospirillales bacterium]